MVRKIKKPKLKGRNKDAYSLNAAGVGKAMEIASPQDEEEIVDTVESESDDDVYDDDVDEKLVEEDEINPNEAGFMEGYGEPKLALCRNKCGETVDVENPVVHEVKGKEYYFCSEECANEFVRKGHGQKKE